MIGDEAIAVRQSSSTLESSAAPPTAPPLHPSPSIVSPQALAPRAIPFAPKRSSSFPMLTRSTSPGPAVVAQANTRP